jgi:hypothetical protein
MGVRHARGLRNKSSGMLLALEISGKKRLRGADFPKMLIDTGAEFM